MIAGLPGTGIGGLFYMLIALWMPVNEVINIALGRANSKNTQLVKNNLFLTLCIVVAVVATGWLAGVLAVLILFGPLASESVVPESLAPIEGCQWRIFCILPP